jgi:primosomal protein N' (replication factor Y)
LPTVRVARLDRDSVRKRGALNEILAAWHAHELDVLIGTQMVAKGHDVPGVTLVGVLLADISLNLPDFRAAERTFQLLTQVAGRAGRGNDPGRVIIQTYSPQHYSIRAAVQHDFTRFATQELRYRKQLAYPPFARAVNIRFEGSDGDKVCAYAEQFAEKLHAAIDAEHTAKGSSGSAVLLGPAPAPIEKIKGRERWHLLLKGEQPRALHALIQHARQELLAHQVRGIRTIVDVDPYSML